MAKVEPLAKSKKKLSILLVCPLAVGESRLHALAWQSIQGLVWDQSMDVLLLRDDAPDSPHMSNLTAKLNHARDIFLQGDYNAMFVVEADMIVPPHALQRLTRAKADIAYGLYCSRNHDHRWLAYAALESNGHGPVVDHGGWGKVVPSCGVGFGCTLIHRRVLEALPFREMPDEGQWPDWNLALDASAGGFKQAHDLGVVCGHVINADPLRTLWPIEQAPYYRLDDPAKDRLITLAQNASDGKYVTLKPITSITTGKTIPAGEKIELSAAIAAEFLRKEIVEPCDETAHEGEL